MLFFRIKCLARDGQADNKADYCHQKDVGTDTRLVFIEIGNLLYKFIFCQRLIAERLHLLFDIRRRGAALGFNQDI
jgi:hypothetical protein